MFYKNNKSDESDCKEDKLAAQKVPTKDNIHKHTKNNANGDNGVSCTNCGLVIKTKKELKEHRLSIHENISCKHCDFKTEGRQNLRHHTENIHKSNVYKCTHCDYIAFNKSSMTYHTDAKHSTSKYNCYQCDKNFKTTHKLTYHKRHFHKVNFSCNNCTYACDLRPQLREHKFNEHPDIYKQRVRSKHSNRSVSCTKCDFKTKNRKELREHRLSIHANIFCNQCDFKTEWKQRLKQHKESVHEGKIYKCDHCNYLAINTQSLNYHTDMKHISAEYDCDGCDKTFKTRQNLSGHKRKVHKVSIPCNDCTFTCEFRRQLREHKFSEHPEKYNSRGQSKYRPRKLVKAESIQFLTPGFLEGEGSQHGVRLKQRLTPGVEMDPEMYVIASRSHPPHRFLAESASKPLLFISGRTLKMNKSFLQRKIRENLLFLLQFTQTAVQSQC